MPTEKKSLRYYKSLDYKVIVEKESGENDSGYIAYSTEFGRYSCYGIGESRAQAIDDFQIQKDDFIELLFDHGKPIPEPIREPVDHIEYSGKFLIRTSPQVHRFLAIQSKSQGVSLNQFVNNILSSASTLNEVNKHIDQRFRDIELLINDHHQHVCFNITKTYGGHK